jgi:FdhD protein
VTEGLARTPNEIEDIKVRPQGEGGVVLDIDFAETAVARFWNRLRLLAGPSGCGLCDIESIAHALRSLWR